MGNAVVSRTIILSSRRLKIPTINRAAILNANPVINAIHNLKQIFQFNVIRYTSLDTKG